MFARRKKSVGGGNSNNNDEEDVLMMGNVNGLNGGGSHDKDRDIMNKMHEEAFALGIPALKVLL